MERLHVNHLMNINMTGARPFNRTIALGGEVLTYYTTWDVTKRDNHAPSQVTTLIHFSLLIDLIM